MHGIRGYLINTLWLMSRPLLRLAVAFFVGIFVVRYLGPARFGQLSFAESFVRLFVPFVTLGMDPILVKHLVSSPRKSHSILGTAFVMKMMGVIVMMICVTVAVQFTSSDVATKLMTVIIAFSIGFLPFFQVTDQYFQSLVKAKYSALCENTAVFFSASLKAIFVCLRLSVVWFAVVIFLESVVRFTVLFLMYLRQIGKVTAWRFDGTYARLLIRESWPMFFSVISGVLYLRIDQVMIKEMMGNEALGFYAAAVRLSEMWYFIPTTLAMSLFPAIIEAKNTNCHVFQKRMHSFYALLFWIAIAIAIPLSFLSTDIVILLFGCEYESAGPVLNIHIWAAVFVFLRTASTRWILAEGWTRKVLYMSAGGLCINLLLNFLLIPRIGIIGAAVATLMAEFYTGLVYDAVDRDMRPSFLMKIKVWIPFWRVV